jgi:LysM repeat protein
MVTEQKPAPRSPLPSQPAARTRATHASPPARPSGGGSRAWRRLGIFILGLSAVVLLVLTAGLVSASLLYTSDLIPGGFQAMGVSIGGGTQAQAEQTLAQAWARQTVTVDLGSGQRQTLRPEDFGIELDAKATVRLAYDQGRSTAAMEQMLRSRQLALPDTPIELVWKFDAGRADQTLQTLARQTYIAPQSATIRVENGEVKTTPPANGQALDVAASGAHLSSDPWAVVRERRFEPVIAAVTPQVTDTSPVAAQVQAWLSAPVAMHLYDPFADEKLNWEVAPSAVGEWVSITPKDDNPGELQAQIDKTRANTYLNDQARALGERRYIDLEKVTPALLASIQGNHEQLNLRIYQREQPYTVKSGETLSSIADVVGIPYPWIQKANPGLGDSLRAGQVITIPSPDPLVPLTPIENKRIVVGIKEQKVWVYENGELKWEWVASTGMSFSPTAPGIFQIQTHEKNAYAGNWNLWMPNFMGVYRPVPDVDFMNGFHGFPSRDGAQFLWTKDLGHPITYGCILLSNENEAKLYAWAEEGVVVQIKG